jgi:hypothetical protein
VNAGELIMKTLAMVNGVIFVIVTGIAVSIGFDVKKWHSWLFGAYGFLTFFLVGLVGTGNIIESIKIGIIVAFVTIFIGMTTRWTRERAKNWLREQDKKEEESYRKLS